MRSGRERRRENRQIASFLFSGLGTGGTSTGTGLALKKLLPNVIRVGVTTQPGDRVPGPRSEALLGPVKFPWRDAIDTMEWVGSEPSYRSVALMRIATQHTLFTVRLFFFFLFFDRLSMQLCRNGLQVGPSSGFNLQGLFQYLTKLKESGELQRVREASGGIVKAVFLCCDLPYQYTDDYFTKLPATDFGTIKNEVSWEVLIRSSKILTLKSFSCVVEPPWRRCSSLRRCLGTWTSWSSWTIPDGQRK